MKLLRSWSQSRGQPPLPPGPKGLPVIGSALDVSGLEQWEAARKLGETYGDIITFIFRGSLQSSDILFARAHTAP